MREPKLDIPPSFNAIKVMSSELCTCWIFAFETLVCESLELYLVGFAMIIVSQEGLDLVVSFDL